MTNFLTKTITLLFAIVIACTAYSQRQYGSIAGRVIAQEENSSEYRTISGVTIELFTATDTLGMTLSDSRFFFNRISPGKATIRFSYLGYKTVVQELEVKAGETSELNIVLQTEVFDIGAVSVKTSVPLYIVKEDTIIFNPAAVKTLENDETIEILRQMPGVILSGGSINVMGQEVERTYVDSRLIFGDDPMAALNNLLAADVIKIRAYDEPRNKGKDGLPHEMIRVLNIETKSKLIAATTGHFLGSYGYDIPTGGSGSHARYGIGATGNFFSENFLLSGNAFFNNINRTSNKVSELLDRSSKNPGYNRNTYVDIGFVRKWPTDYQEYSQPIKLQANYTFSNDYSKSENILDQLYFPSVAEGYEKRTIDDTARNTTTRRTHNMSVDFRLPTAKAGNFSLIHNLTFSNANDNSFSSYYVRTDDQPVTGTRSRQESDYADYHLSEILGWDRSFGEQWGLALNGQFQIGEGDGNGVKYDSLFSTETTTFLTTSPLHSMKEIMGNVHLSFYPRGMESAEYFILNYQYNYKNDLRKQLAFDRFHGLPDEPNEINTFDYTTNHHTHSGKLQYSKTFLKSRIMLIAILGGQTVLIDKTERMPGDSYFKSRFNAFLPSLSLQNMSMISSFSILYFANPIIPYIEQLRPRLNNNNLYSLSVGNPNLNQSYRHNLTAGYNHMFGKTSSSLGLTANASYTNNYIAMAQRFFATDTPLAEYEGYVAPAGSTLTTYDNIDGQWSADAKITYRTPLRKLKSNLTIAPGFTFYDTPAFRGEQVIRTKEYTPEFSVSLSSNFSRSVRLVLGSTTGYTYAENNFGDSYKYLRESLTASATVNNLFKHLVFNAKYQGIFYRDIKTTDTDNSHILNLSLGCKVFKRMGEIGIAVYDVLNRTSGFTTAMTADYIKNSWQEMFGRYFTVNFALKFNKIRPGLSTPADINDGSMKWQ